MKIYPVFFALWFGFISSLFAQTNISLTLTATNAKCNGNTNGSITAAVSGGKTPYTYTWNTNPVQHTQTATNLSAGMYQVIVTDSNHISITDSVLVSQPPPLSVYIDSIVVQPCFREEGGVCGCGNTLWAVVQGGTAPYHYLWTPGGQRTDSVFNVCYVEFSVTVTDTNSCVSRASLNVVTPPSPHNTSGINQVTNNSTKWAAYPNPAGNQVFISTPYATNNAKVEVYTLTGAKMTEQKIDSSEKTSLDVSTLPEGTYLLKIQDDTQQKFLFFSIER
ncbi:MAG: T9SS type A sorting domain-containing protein [Bacteroidetes bacterium]|nr:T9SS type A sorting domain-containing protein [Bacteroidota bacterium]